MQGPRLGSGLGVISLQIRENVTVHSVHRNEPKFISDCLRKWNFGLYVSGFWHIHAKTPRGIEPCEQ